jgi:hypothetical protein
MIKRKFTNAALAVCVALLIPFLAGCSDPYGACVKADADIAQGISSGFVTVTQLQQQNLISTAEALDIAGYLEYANQADEAFGACAQEAHTSGSKAGAFTSCAQTFNTTLNSPTELALIHVTNTKASGEITTIVNGITTGVTAVITALGGK